MLFPQINDDCSRIILSLLDKPELAALSRASRLTLSYARPWLVRDLNIGISAQFINRGICRFVLAHGLGPYIRILSISPSHLVPLGRCSLFGPVVDESLRLLADVIEVATNLVSFKMEPLYQGYIIREPRLVFALQSRPRLQRLQLTNIGGADVSGLTGKALSGLRCLQLALGDASDGSDVFDVVFSSAQTLEELSICSRAPYVVQKTSGNQIACLRLRSLSLFNVRMDPYVICQAFPNLQHLKTNSSDYSDSPFTSYTPRKVTHSSNLSFPELRSISGHSVLLTLPFYSVLQRVHIEQLINSKEMLQDVLALLKRSPLISVALLIRTNSPEEESLSQPGYTHWPLPAASVIPMVAGCIPQAQYLELGFSWAGFRATGRSPQVCAESILLSHSACRPLAALKELRYASFTVPGPRELGHETHPNMQAIADDISHTLPAAEYLTLRSKGWYTHLLHYRCAKRSCNGSVDAAVSLPGRLIAEITGAEAQRAYQEYSWNATDVEPWCAEGHEWE